MSVAAITESAQYLTFSLAEEIFAFDVKEVREILDFTPLTKIPQTPSFMMGVINLRGRVVPVIDLRKRFAMDGSERTVHSCIIVIELVIDGKEVVVGILADAVQEVIDLAQEQIEVAPRLDTRMNTDFIRGIGKHGSSFVVIIDINKIFSNAELELTSAAAA